MDGCGHGIAMASMAAVSTPGAGTRGPVCQQQCQPVPTRNAPNRRKQCTTIARAKAVVPEHHPGTFGKAGDRGDQLVTKPFVGHQPQTGERGGVARAHCDAYSAAMSEAEPFSARLSAINARIAKACKLAGRSAEEVTLVAISKTYPAEAIAPAIAAGLRVFGENRVQEAAEKWPQLIAATPDVTLDLVGQLQSNKAEDAVRLFDAIHAVDRASLITALARAQDKLGKRPRCFIQVNIGNEAQKGGCPVADLPAILATARAAGLDLAGLMAVPPAGIEAAPFFALLAKFARDHGLTGLSMGMSDDFESAIMLGATHIRIGSALFGSRG